MTATELLLRRDRLIIGTSLAVICLLCWLYLLTGVGTGISAAAMTTWQFPPPTLMYSQHNRQMTARPAPTIKRSRRSNTSVAVILVIVGLSGGRALYNAMVVQVDMGELRITVFK